MGAAPLIRWMWLTLAQAIAVSVIALGASWAILWATSEPDRPVIEPVGEVEHLTRVVRYRGTVQYTLDLKRNASCPGTVVTTLISRTNHGPSATVTFSRPVINTEIRDYPDIRGSIELPDSVFPARWRMQSSVYSVCPTYSRVDPYLDVEIEVVAP